MKPWLWKEKWWPGRLCSVCAVQPQLHLHFMFYKEDPKSNQTCVDNYVNNSYTQARALMPHWINHKISFQTQINKQITWREKGWNKGAQRTGPIEIRNNHCRSIQPLHTPWGRFGSDNLPLGNVFPSPVLVSEIYQQRKESLDDLEKVLSKGSTDLWNDYKATAPLMDHPVVPLPSMLCSGSLLGWSRVSAKIQNIPKSSQDFHE